MDSRVLSLLFFCLCSSSVLGYDIESVEAEIVERYTELFRNASFEKLYYETFVTGRTEEEKRNLKACPVLAPSAEKPNSVHRLRPNDVKVVAAMGDSLTAGRGARMGILGLLSDFRGASWSIGGDSGASFGHTLPNLLKYYNPAVYGYSTGSGERKVANSHLNLAKSGDESKHMLEQAVMLVERMKEDPNVDLENDWKVVTLFIGGNDLCDFCNDEIQFSPIMYKANIRAALDYLHENSPRTLVNLVEILNIETIEELAKGLVCKAVHTFVCSCASHPRNDAAREKLSQAKTGYQDAVRDLAGSGRYDTRGDFTVVLQPFYRETDLPRLANGKIDYSYFAADCFHYSAKGHEFIGEALWNNMFQPVGSKGLTWSPGAQVVCPSEEHPFIYTSKNSHS